MTTFNLTCEAVEATLPDYLDETLEAWVRESIDEHLGECVRCAGLVRDLRNMEREAATQPVLVPERDLWPEVAHGIGVPVITSASMPEGVPLMASNEPPVSPSAPLPVSEPSLPTTEASVAIAEPSPPIAESSPPIAGPSLPIAEPSPPITEPSLLIAEAPVSADEPVLPSAEAPVLTTVPPIALPQRNERRWRPSRMGLAAAALVLVTAGTTFLLTAHWLGPGRTPHVVTDTVTRQLSSAVKLPADREILAPPVGGQQISPDSSSPGLPGQLRSSLTVATTSAPQVARSPEEVVYDKEIKMLQAMMRRRKAELDASTAAVIEKNLRIVDSNIAQCRAALQKDPASSLLGGQVSRALDMKVELLRRVAMLRSNT